MAQDPMDLVHRFNRSRDKTVVVPNEYLEVVATKRQKAAEVSLLPISNLTQQRLAAGYDTTNAPSPLPKSER